MPMPLPPQSNLNKPEQQVNGSLAEVSVPCNTQIAHHLPVSRGKGRKRGKVSVRPGRSIDQNGYPYQQSLRHCQAQRILSAVGQQESGKSTSNTKPSQGDHQPISNNTQQAILPASKKSKAWQRLKSTISPAQEKGGGKRGRVDTSRLSTLLDYSPSLAGKSLLHNGTEPVTTAHDFASYCLPDPRLPPTNQDNTQLWAAVMAKTKQDLPTSHANVNAPHGERGTVDYGHMLFKIGIDLQDLWEKPQFTATTDPCTYPGFETQEKVSNYVVDFDSEKARAFATGFKKWLDRLAPNETVLSHCLAEKLFPEPPFKCTAGVTSTDRPGENALLRNFEQAHHFEHLNTAELQQDIYSFPIVRSSPGEREKGLSALESTPQTVPAEKDLRGRCDIVFGLTDQCMDEEISGAEIDIPCYHRASNICSVFLRAELKKSTDDYPAAVHQFAIAAYLTLLHRVRMARPDEKSVLDSRDSSGRLRHYGYVICRHMVHIWEMSVERCQKAMSSDNMFLRFPCKRLRALNLFNAKHVQEFSKWHARILAWGLHVYSTQYLSDVKVSLSCESITISYKKAVGPKACDHNEFVHMDIGDESFHICE